MRQQDIAVVLAINFHSGVDKPLANGFYLRLNLSSTVTSLAAGVGDLQPMQPMHSLQFFTLGSPHWTKVEQLELSWWILRRLLTL